MPTPSSPVGLAEPPSEEGQKRPKDRGGLWKFVDNKWIVLAILFFVTAALGLPILWASRGFSKAAKAVLSIVVLAYTALILWLFYLVMAWALSRVQDAWPT